MTSLNAVHRDEDLARETARLIDAGTFPADAADEAIANVSARRRKTVADRIASYSGEASCGR